MNPRAKALTLALGDLSAVGLDAKTVLKFSQAQTAYDKLRHRLDEFGPDRAKAEAARLSGLATAALAAGQEPNRLRSEDEIVARYAAECESTRQAAWKVVEPLLPELARIAPKMVSALRRIAAAHQRDFDLLLAAGDRQRATGSKGRRLT